MRVLFKLHKCGTVFIEQLPFYSLFGFKKVGILLIIPIKKYFMHAIVAVTHSINWPCNIEDFTQLYLHTVERI